MFDCFTFYNESDILEFRLQSIDSVVDKFILVESNLSHTYKKKPLYWKDYFSKEKRFESYLHKIDSYVFDGHSVQSKDPMKIENEQRRYLKTGCIISGINENDYVMISDVDEIYSADGIQMLLNTGMNPVRGYLMSISYYVNLYYKNEPFFGTWSGPYITKYSTDLDFQESRLFADGMMSMKNQFKLLPIDEQLGWHLSWLHGSEYEKIIDKQHNWLHGDPNSYLFFDVVNELNDMKTYEDYRNALQQKLNAPNDPLTVNDNFMNDKRLSNFFTRPDMQKYIWN